jgi:hypothetical protein
MLSTILLTRTRHSETLVSRICNKAFGPLLLTAIILTSNVKCAEWKGIKPLSSRREDVIKLLGKGKLERPDQSVYQFKNERVSFQYSTGSCGDGQNAWDVPVGTVTSIWVEPTALRLSDVKLRITDYKKERDPEVNYVYYLVDEIRGSKYTVDDSSNLITMIEYFPTLAEQGFRCRD